MKDEFQNVTRFVKKHQNNIVVMLSHLDHTSTISRNRIKKNVDNLRRQINVRHTIMYGLHFNTAELANAMYACMRNIPQININVTDEIGGVVLE